MTENINLIIEILILAWLIILSFLFFRFKFSFNRLFKKTDNKNLEQLLIEIWRVQKANQKEVSRLKKEIEKNQQNLSFCLQHIGIIKFNPFSDTGGEQSFCVSLLDKNKNGIVFTCLHARQGTRIYSKQIVNGKGKEFELSQEEKDSIKNAVI